eukprot:3515627-Pyramimonas_sp.AAC.1
MKDASQVEAWRVRGLHHRGSLEPRPSGRHEYPVVERSAAQSAGCTTITRPADWCFAGTHRQANRHRHTWRRGAQQRLHSSSKIRIAVQNVQGLNW